MRLLLQRRFTLLRRNNHSYISCQPALPVIAFPSPHAFLQLVLCSLLLLVSRCQAQGGCCLFWLSAVQHRLVCLACGGRGAERYHMLL